MEKLKLDLLQDSLNKHPNTTTRLDLASVILNDLSLYPKRMEKFVPLTASLYINRTVDNADKGVPFTASIYVVRIVDDSNKALVDDLLHRRDLLGFLDIYG
ncbi:hypothetical protein TorRG33x02_306600 [Trema orientale]|uniref:Uncharacterized protein n=1 Tax=Trema orientale TaxID=63057 RepID=A0A2P5BW84_TREOI|nr:hypothetical protein TorRG33x02_306600 [Trema orientale]